MSRADHAAAAAEHAPRRPETTILYSVLRKYLKTWLAHARARERTVPGFVEDELRAFLDCGIPANGFLRLHCDACGLDRVVPFSCCPELKTMWSLPLQIRQK